METTQIHIQERSDPDDDLFSGPSDHRRLDFVEHSASSLFVMMSDLSGVSFHDQESL
jgi:hypothetical protein